MQVVLTKFFIKAIGSLRISTRSLVAKLPYFLEI